MPFNGLLFGPELEGAACQLCQAECLRAAILLHRISTQPTVNNISTEGKIVYFRSIWQNYDTKSLANTSTGPNNKEQNTNKNCYFLPESLCSLLWRRDGWYRLERESFQSAICTPGEESRVSTLHRISAFVQISVLFQKSTEKRTENLCISNEFYRPPEHLFFCNFYSVAAQLQIQNNCLQLTVHHINGIWL